jgi:hypothetical protein
MNISKINTFCLLKKMLQYGIFLMILFSGESWRRMEYLKKWAKCYESNDISNQELPFQKMTFCSMNYPKAIQDFKNQHILVNQEKQLILKFWQR